MRTEQQQYEDALRTALRKALRSVLHVGAVQPKHRAVLGEFAVLEFPDFYNPDDEEWAKLAEQVEEWLTHPDCPVVVTREVVGRKWPHVYRIYLAPAV